VIVRDVVDAQRGDFRLGARDGPTERLNLGK
jgi:hypothetical protein